MSLELTSPQGFAPIRVKRADLSDFFTAIKNRRLVRGNTIANFQVTTKPFEGTALPQKPLGIQTKIPTTAGDKTSNKKRGHSTQIDTAKSTPKKKRAKLEAKIRKAKI